MSSTKISLLIPVYNEESHLEDFFNNLKKVEFPCDVEYVFVDDGSSDNSWKIIEEKFKGQDGVIAFKQPKNMGKGSAIHKAISLSTGDLVAVQDADFEYDPFEMPDLIKPILENKADVVFGSRFHRSRAQVHRTFHFLVNRFLTLVSNLLSGLYLTDMETCYKIFRSEIIKGINLDSKRFGFEPEVTAKLGKLNVRVHEYPISYYPRNYLEGKKITWKDGVEALIVLFKYNFQSLKTSVNDKMPKKYVPKGKIWL